MHRVDATTIDYRKFNRKTLGADVTSVIREVEYSKDDENITLLQKASDYYDSLSKFREKRKRNRKYARGDQWHEKTTDPDSGETITEEELIKKNGKIPFKQNIIRTFIKNLLGQYRQAPSKTAVIARNKEDSKVGEMLTNTLQAVLEMNQAKELDVSALHEALISGGAISKSMYKYYKNRDLEDGFIRNVNINRFFFNTDIEDVRIENDLTFCGEIHDLNLLDVVSQFASNPKDEAMIRSIYSNAGDKHVLAQTGLSTDRIDNLTFFLPSDPHKCRVIEMWYLTSKWTMFVHDTLTGESYTTDESEEELAHENIKRVKTAQKQGISINDVPTLEYQHQKEQVWNVKFMTPTGYTLYHGETPYTHQEHPYTIFMYPFIDGEAWGLVDDLVDQQRYINRIISLLDFIIGASAKGVLLVPEESISDDFDLDDIAEEWTKYNGVIKIKGKKGVQMPQQIVANSSNMGAKELLNIQMQLMQEIAGVSPAAMGHNPKSGTPSSLYAQQTQNSSINSLDFIESFNNFIKRRNTKLMKVLLQYYKEKRLINISGADYKKEANVYDPEKVRNADIDLVITQSVDAPVYRQIIDDMLFQLYQSQGIDIKMFLNNTSLPFADNLLEDINRREEEAKQQQQEMMQQQVAMQQGATMQGVSPQQQQEMPQGKKTGGKVSAERHIDPSTLDLINRMKQFKN